MLAMATKKKISETASKPITGSKTTLATKPEGKSKPATPAGPSEYDLQLKTYEEAIRLFSQRKLSEARDCFIEAAKGPAAQISDKARSYAQICERRTFRVEVNFKTAEDHFNVGVERLNARDVEQAKHHFGRALAIEPDADHILYTMALCCGLAGDGNGACENLKRAIDLEPRNRILARQDPEFSALALQMPGLRALLVTES
jgi:tetratricopeptide (TPR) repeat protein